MSRAPLETPQIYQTWAESNPRKGLAGAANDAFNAARSEHANAERLSAVPRSWTRWGGVAILANALAVGALARRVKRQLSASRGRGSFRPTSSPD